MPTPRYLFKNRGEPTHISQPFECDTLGHTHSPLSLCGNSIETAGAKHSMLLNDTVSVCSKCLRAVIQVGAVESIDCVTYEGRVEAYRRRNRELARDILKGD